MGIEDQPAVEESTEPPICSYIDATLGTPPDFVRQNTAIGIAGTVAGFQSPGLREGTSSSAVDGGHPEPHKLAVEDLEIILNTDVKNGLGCDEAARRLHCNGLNRVEGAQGLSAWKILLRQVSNSLTMVLIIVMALSFAINDYIEGGVIAAVISLNIIVGYVLILATKAVLANPMICFMNIPR